MNLKKRHILKVVALVAWVLASVGCPFQNNERRLIGPEVNADLIIYFKFAVTEEQIVTFWHEVLSRTRADGKGDDPRPGLGLIRRESAVQGHEGISLSFFTNATQAQRDDFEREVKSSPLVYKVLKNTAPINVKKID